MQADSLPSEPPGKPYIIRCLTTCHDNRCCCCFCCCCSVIQSCPTLYDPMDHSTPGFLAFHCHSGFAQTHSIESMMPSNHCILCCPLLLSSVFLSVKVFSNELAFLIRWPKYWSYSISPSSEYSGFISFRIDW